MIIEVNEGKNDERFLSVFSVCGPAEPAHYASALALNGRLTTAASRSAMFWGAHVRHDAHVPRDRVRASEIRDAILEIAAAPIRSSSN